MSQTLTEAQLTTLIAWVPHTRIKDSEAILAALRDQLEATRAPIVFAPLEGGGWCVDGRYYHGRCPAGLALVWQAVCAFQGTAEPPLVEAARRHAVGKAIKTDVMKRARLRCRRLVPVIECISIERGRVVYNPLPGIPEVITRK